MLCVNDSSQVIINEDNMLEIKYLKNSYKSIFREPDLEWKF